ncbi:protein spinster homolog 3 isoform X4 [Equus asinus]|uniref:protein spinster homolog 3 isoform X4 n=1 Tax=Equus asinus TaxID=9793 RepID=UPI0038F63C85
MHVCTALLPAGTANPLWPPVLQTFFLWNASLLFSCLEVVSAMPAGVLLDVQKFFQISDSNAGLLQTVFISCLLLSAPVFGYLGDRHSRKATLSFGILLWSGAGLSGSFVSPRYSWLFFLSRGVVGTGTASYSTIAPTILGDLFVRDQRTRVLAIFYIFIPVGSGLGYVLGSAVTELTGNWHWALRVMPCLEAVALILLIVLVPDPPRGAAEKQGAMAMGGQRSSWCEDVRYLGRNWSFVWSTLGVTAMAFVTGALGFWVPKFLFEARVVHGLQPPCLQEPCSSQDSLIFGALTVVTGIVGVVLGAEVSRSYKRVNPRAEPLICASSLLAAAPCLYLALVLAPITFPFSYVFLAFGELLLSCNWAVVADILLSVVVPRCRGTAEALQITVGHILGDAGSPYLTGLLSSALRAGRPDSYLQRFLSLQQSFLCCTFVLALGGGCFLLTALHLEGDQARAQQPCTGTPAPRTHARLRAEPCRSREHWPPPEPPASSFIHSKRVIRPLLCARQGADAGERMPGPSPCGGRDRQKQTKKQRWRMFEVMSAMERHGAGEWVERNRRGSLQFLKG